mmetsp:Transcript_30408/g.76658  ORF Transcript_30408/g.76658 Transcript_30408/m.76658 type:complete len:229 (-) Transcript_30408:698-1384(-)
MSASPASFSRVAIKSSSSSRCRLPEASRSAASSPRMRSVSLRAAASPASASASIAAASALCAASAPAAASAATRASASATAARASASAASRRACSAASCSCTVFISWSLASSRFSYSCVRLPSTLSSTGPIASNALSGVAPAPRGGVGVCITGGAGRPAPSVHMRSRSIAVHCCISRVTPTAAATPLPAAILNGGVTPGSKPSPGVPYSLPGVARRPLAGNPLAVARR